MRRLLLLLVVVGSIAVVVGLPLYVWVSNTETLTIVHTVDDPAAPGEDVTVPRPDDDEVCAPGYERLYRRSIGGRWRQTHLSGYDGWTHDEVKLWSWPKSRQLFSLLPCPLGDTVTLTIPRDVAWSPVVACEMDNSRCVRVAVDLD